MRRGFVLFATASFLAAAVGLAETPTPKPKILLREDTSIPGREGVMATVEMPPGAAEARHSHPADAFGFMLAGTVSLEVEGRPTAILKAGDVYNIPAGKIHQATNIGTDPVKVAVVFVAEKGKPLVTPAK